MRSIYRILCVLVVFCLTLIGIFQIAEAQDTDYLYFPETRHSVRGPFLKFYKNLKDPLLLLGFPIDEEFQDPITGKKVQYFQNGRLDLRLNSKTEVEISDLGKLLYEPGSGIVPEQTASPTCRYFPKTGKSVCHAFREFYEIHQGDRYFGLPISELEIRDGIYVQYFERIRLEWRPDKPPGQHVRLTSLGKIYYDRLGITPRVDLNAPVSRPVSLQVNAFVEHALLPAGSQQTIYIITWLTPNGVVNSTPNPASGAIVALTVINPDGSVEYYRTSPTNSMGVTSITLPAVKFEPTRMIKIEVDAQHQGSSAGSSTWFRVWW